MFDDQPDMQPQPTPASVLKGKGAIGRRSSIIRKVFERLEIDRETGCWIWTGPTSGKGRGGGYGRMNLEGQTVAVHKVVASHFLGFVPGKRQIDHTCRNRLCCNPAHLEIVTHKENQRRRDAAIREDSDA